MRIEREVEDQHKALLEQMQNASQLSDFKRGGLAGQIVALTWVLGNLGIINFANAMELPREDPGRAGQVWRDRDGALKISLGTEEG